MFPGIDINIEFEAEAAPFGVGAASFAVRAAVFGELSASDRGIRRRQSTMTQLLGNKFSSQIPPQQFSPKLG